MSVRTICTISASARRYQHTPADRRNSVAFCNPAEKSGVFSHNIQWMASLRRSQVSCRLAYCRDRSFTSAMASATVARPSATARNCLYPIACRAVASRGRPLCSSVSTSCKSPCATIASTRRSMRSFMSSRSRKARPMYAASYRGGASRLRRSCAPIVSPVS